VSGKKSRDKGARRELEFSKLIDGTKVPLSGAMGGEFSNDVHGLGLQFEVKARKDGFKTIYNWLLDEREKPDALALKADRKPWLVVMTLQQFMELMNK
jgi:GTPase SAR1 family protein